MVQRLVALHVQKAEPAQAGGGVMLEAAQAVAALGGFENIAPPIVSAFMIVGQVVNHRVFQVAKDEWAVAKFAKPILALG